MKFWVVDDCFDEKNDHAILHVMAHARRYAKWQVAAFLPDMGQRILEIGSGIGNISRLLPKREHLTVSDCSEECLEVLQSAFEGNELVGVEKFDLASDEGVERLRGAGYDTVVCLNVLERMEDDAAALQRVRSILQPGGKLLLLVPQGERLFGSYDRLIGRHRRYEQEGLREKLEAAGFSVSRIQGFNRVGALVVVEFRGFPAETNRALPIEVLRYDGAGFEANRWLSAHFGAVADCGGRSPMMVRLRGRPGP